mgnify:CR=1 FL=1
MADGAITPTTAGLRLLGNYEGIATQSVVPYGKTGNPSVNDELITMFTG